MVSRKVHMLADPRGRRPLSSALLLAISLAWLLGLAVATHGSRGCAVALALGRITPVVDHAGSIPRALPVPALASAAGRGDAG